MDNGKGIGDEKRRLIFNSSGLALCRRLIELQRGELALRDGMPTTFEIFFPGDVVRFASVEEYLNERGRG